MTQVSVIMPVYNQQDHVARAVESILNQTFADFEFIIIDDGSTDGTVDVLKGFKDKRIRIIEESHVGFLVALSKGLSVAGGQWIARMDSDDICHPERLMKQIQFLEEHPECCFVGTSYGIITPNEKYLAPLRSDKWEYLSPKDITYATCLFADPSVVFDRAKALEAGYDLEWENEKPLWYRLLNAGRGAVLKYPYYYTRWTWGSFSRSKLSLRAWENQNVRLKYDSESKLKNTNSQLIDSDKYTISAATKCINYYLAADDFEAARKLSLSLIQKYPFNKRAWKLFIRSFAKINSDVKKGVAKAKFSFSKANSLW